MSGDNITIHISFGFLILLESLHKNAYRCKSHKIHCVGDDWNDQSAETKC